MTSMTYLAARVVRSWLCGPAAFEHFEHAVGDEESADDVAGRGDNGDGAENSRVGGLVFTCQARLRRLPRWRPTRW